MLYPTSNSHFADFDEWSTGRSETYSGTAGCYKFAEIEYLYAAFDGFVAQIAISSAYPEAYMCNGVVSIKVMVAPVSMGYTATVNGSLIIYGTTTNSPDIIAVRTREATESQSGIISLYVQKQNYQSRYAFRVLDASQLYTGNTPLHGKFTKFYKVEGESEVAVADLTPIVATITKMEIGE